MDLLQRQAFWRWSEFLNDKLSALFEQKPQNKDLRNMLKANTEMILYVSMLERELQITLKSYAKQSTELYNFKKQFSDFIDQEQQ